MTPAGGQPAGGHPAAEPSADASRPADEAGLRARIAAIPVEGTTEARRRAFRRLLGHQPEAERLTLGGRDALAVGEGPTVLFWHGGGYVFGEPETHLMAAHALAARGLRVVLPSYRLAPEHVWPAQLEDALAALDAAPGDVALAGISAGGHLALNAALARPGRAAALYLMSPNTDRTGRSATRGRDGDAMNDGATDAELGAMALGHLPDDHPEKSPLGAALGGLPPLRLDAAGAEILLDDALLLARAAALAEVDVALRVRPGLMHMFHLWPDALAQGAAALADGGDWLRARLG